jgi:hypothetical protein
MQAKKIIIIDDNADAAKTIKTACDKFFREWSIVWLRVINPAPDPFVGSFQGVVLTNLAAAQARLAQEAEGPEIDLVVFYDLQLLGVQEPAHGAMALRDSPLTQFLRKLVADKNRRTLVDLHTRNVWQDQADADLLGKGPANVISRHFFAGVDSKRAEEFVGETRDTWDALYPDSVLGFDLFLSILEGLSSKQMHDLQSDFVYQQPDGKAVTFQNLGELLRKFLRLSSAEFSPFLSEDILSPGVHEALKSISGMRSDLRALRFGGAWILALGRFRELFPLTPWTDVFHVADLSLALSFPAVHARQTTARRRHTFGCFNRMCTALFANRTDQKQTVLKRVELTHTPQRSSLSFLLGFPCELPEEHNSLVGRVQEFAYSAMNGQRPPEADHDSSRAIWDFFLSSAMSDDSESIRREESGLFGRYIRMNIISRMETQETLLLWES